MHGGASGTDVWICRLDTLKAALKEGLEELYHRYCMVASPPTTGLYADVQLRRLRSGSEAEHLAVTLEKSLGCRP